MFGLVEVLERIWRNPQKNHIRILPQAIGVSHRRRSRRLERALSDFGCEHSFAKAAAAVKEHYGFEIHATAVREATLEHSQRACQILEDRYKQPFRVLPQIAEEHVIAQTDGSMLCTIQPSKRKDKKPREWKEMRLMAARAKDKVQTFYAATFGQVAEAGNRWGHCARDAGWGQNSRIHALGDGAEWIRLQTGEVFGTQGKFLCDFYHVSEYLAEASQSCRPKAPQQWRRTQQQRLKRAASAKVIQCLVEYLEPEGTSEEEAPVRNCHRYISNRTDCIDYPEALKLGLPIGSGMIESGHRHIIQARLKKAGTAWLAPHANQIANLRVLRANGWWSSMWN